MVSLDQSILQYPHAAGCMATSLAHRGPDGAGTFESCHALLGATRLRIIDRRPSGDQPFVGPSGTVVVCNGELYNGLELRARYPAYPYRSKTDVEPLVPLLESKGSAGFSALDGMFAIAAWIPGARTLLLARDRAGEKPLFYLHLRNEVWFASEIQALRTHPLRPSGLDPHAIADYLALGYVREPRTLHEAIRKVPAGTVIRFNVDGSTKAPVDLSHGRNGNRGGDNPDQLRALLETAVRKQVHADVPVGVFLSGGLDSSLVTAFASRARSDTHTFTARFVESNYDEGSFAREVAAHFRTIHHEVLLTPSQLAKALEAVTTRIAEPIADPAILPTTLLAKMAREHAGVVLSGEGSDELFGGYPTYLGHHWAGLAGSLPEWASATLRKLLSKQAASTDRVPLSMLADRFLQHANEPPRRRHAIWFGTGLLPFLPGKYQERIVTESFANPDPVLAAMEIDFSGYLREGLLPKLDRASMLWSLETRAPFLDRSLIEYAKGLPRSRKVDGKRLKLALAEAAAGVVPDWVIKRRKRGLSVPIARWINLELRETVDRLLAPKRIANQMFMPDLPFVGLLDEHRQGLANHSRSLWPLIVLQLWLENWEESDAL